MSAPIVVKLGGGAIADAHRIAPDLKSLCDGGEAVIVVHGGGAQTSELQRALGDELSDLTRAREFLFGCAGEAAAPLKERERDS